MTQTGGQRANFTGRQFETFCASIVQSQGYERIRPAAAIWAARELGQPIYASQVIIGKSIYGKDRKVDLLLFHPTKHPDGLVVQCKWQSSGGSVDEKYPFEVLNIQQGTLDTIIVLDGGGYSDGAKEWLSARAGAGLFRYLLDLGGFQRYARDQL